MKAMLTMISNNGVRTTMADGKVEVELSNKQVIEKGKKERIWKDEEIEAIITLYEDRACLWDVAHQDNMNRDKMEVAYCQIDV